MNSTWLVGTLVAALIVAGTSIAVAVTRFVRSAPEQREQENAAFTAATTAATNAQTNVNRSQAEWITYLDGQLKTALGRIGDLETAVGAKDATIAAQAQIIAAHEDRIAELEADLARRPT